MTDYAPVTKRLKNDPSPYPIAAGVVCASESSSLVEKLPVHILPKQCSQEVFFSHGTDEAAIERRESYSISRETMETLQDIKMDENALRDKIFKELRDRHAIVFPASASNGEDDEMYKEDTLENVINEFLTSTIGMDHQSLELGRITRGLPVTTTSLPDATVIRKEADQGGLDDFGKIRQLYCLIFGEFKHGPKYSKKNAAVQCVLYLYAIIFVLRTKLGLPVVAAYGFAFCGHKCKDQKSQSKNQIGSYSVGLIKLSLPTTLFGEIKAESYWTRGDTGDKRPLRLLIDFLMHGNRWEFEDIPRITDGSRLVPSLFMLPTLFWLDNDDRKLIRNGTMAIVFHATKTGLLHILATAPVTISKTGGWKEFQESATKITTESPNERFYLKIRSRDTSLQSSPGSDMKEQWESIQKHSDLAATYPVAPFVRSNMCFVIMRDQGEALKKDSFKTVGTLCFAFQTVLGVGEHLRGSLSHGDMLEHNFVLHSDKRLRVIDLDESVAEHNELPERKVVYTTRKRIKKAPYPNWYAAMRYPNVVRQDNWVYTQIQLIAAFIKLIERSGIETADDVKAQMGQLSAQAKAIGVILEKGDKENDELNYDEKAPLFTKVSQAYDLMKSIMQDAASGTNVE